MVEYGGGINNGPAGQVGGGNPGGGDPQIGQPVDFFGSVTDSIGDAATWLFSLPPEILALGIVAFFAGLIVLKRAF